jgi:hypothetical protein
MNKKNRLNQIIRDLGFKKVVPTEEVLQKLEMTNYRFFQILENKGKKEMTVVEAERIRKWLSEITNNYEIQLFEKEELKTVA